MAGMTGRQPAHRGQVDVRVEPSKPARGRRAAAPPDAPLVPGYLVSEQIGTGGRATVWAGTRDDGLDVALKVIHGGALDPRACQEAEVLQALRIEHVVRQHEAVELGPDLVLVLDLLRGGSLADLVRARGHLTAGECVTVLTPLLTALARLHRAGVAHADVSPGNILFDLAGRPHLGDLGEAVLAGRRVVDPGATLGFVAPEVLLGERAGPAADVYAIGAVGQFCLTGTPPPSALASPPEPPTGTGPADRVLRLCVEAMTQDPDRRPDADALAHTLYDAADAQALELVSALDPTADVTRRLRELVGTSATAAQTPVMTWGAAPSGPRQTAPRPRRWSHPSATPTALRPVHRSVVCSVAGRAALAVGVVASLILVAAVLAGNPSAAVAKARPASPHAAEVAPSAHAVAPTGSTAPVVDARPALPAAADSSAKRGATASTAGPGDLMALVSELARTRASLWADPATGDLSVLDVPGSAAWQQDAADRAARAQAGLRLDGISFEVVSARLVSGEFAADAAANARLTARVEVRTGAHTEVTSSGSRPVVSSVGVPVLLDLVHTDAGWRIEAVRAVT